MEAVATLGAQDGPMLCPTQDGSAQGMVLCVCGGGEDGQWLGVIEVFTKKHRPWARS